MYGQWIVAKASATGTRHLELNTSCQDSYGIGYYPDKGFGIAVVSDGCGSVSHAEEGSRLAVEKALDIFVSKIIIPGFDQLLLSPTQFIEETFIEGFQSLYEATCDYAQEKELDVKSLAATIIVLVFNTDGLICSHIGDGRAGYQDLSGQWFPAMTPYKGEEANETIFLTSDIWENPYAFIQTCVIKQPIQSYTLLTDGCESGCFVLNRFNADTQLYEKANKPYAPFFDPNVEILRNLHAEGMTEDAIDELWGNFLTNGNEVFEAEVDDKTMILGTLIRTGVENDKPILS